ncbi:MAG: anion permease [Spirochaetales bacterium]|nr:anion permease [Spirochaetales bacterium]
MFPVETAGSVLLGWAVGRNDTAHIFGPAVASQSLRYFHALLLCALFVIAGSFLGSQAAFHTLASLSSQSVTTAFAASIASAVTIFVMTMLRLPASLSQIAIGSIIGISIAQGQVNATGLETVFACWGFTPIMAACISLLIYKPVAHLFNKLPVTIFGQDKIIQICLVGTCCYAAYALGANNVAGVMSVFVTSKVLPVLAAVFIGSMAIAAGALMCPKQSMFTVGSKLIRLDPFSAMIVVFSAALTVHFFAFVGVPVSTSQAVTGAILGIGIMKGMQTIRLKTLLMMFVGWLCTPAVAGVLSFLLITLFLQYT